MKKRKRSKRHERLPFVALYRTRKLIIRSEYERYMDEHPEVKEEIRNGR